jgi:hypothetical protein
MPILFGTKILPLDVSQIWTKEIGADVAEEVAGVEAGRTGSAAEK